MNVCKIIFSAIEVNIASHHLMNAQRKRLALCNIIVAIIQNLSSDRNRNIILSKSLFHLKLIVIFCDLDINTSHSHRL